MAIFIPIKKSEETDTHVVYHYGRDEWEPDPERPKRQRIAATKLGCVMMDKSTGEIVRVAGEDWDSQDFYFSRVCRVLRRHWESREFPGETCYAA
jgi:hypothetical protein